MNGHRSRCSRRADPGGRSCEALCDEQLRYPDQVVGCDRELEALRDARSAAEFGLSWPPAVFIQPKISSIRLRTHCEAAWPGGGMILAPCNPVSERSAVCAI